MYKVFINDRSLVLTDNYSDYSSGYSTLFIHYASKDALFACVDLLKNSNVVKQLVVFNKDLAELWKIFTSNYKVVSAGGGIVVRDGKVLMIKKNGFWDLPKGKADGKEAIEKTALREVQEECGLNKITLKDKLETTYYIYQENGNSILKETSWFTMTSEAEGPLEADAKEGITEVKWMDSASWEASKSMSYPSVVSLLSSIL